VLQQGPIDTIRRATRPILALALLTTALPALADDMLAPPISVAGRETIDLWDNASGGIRTDTVLLNKLQLSATVRAPFGLTGFSAHAQILRTDGQSLSARVGDVQTVSNIEAVPATRLFESWVEQRFGDDQDYFALRVGLMDLNSDFDSLTTSAMFLNSSHGIGPDISRSGANGPSIFPVTSLGARFSWLPSDKWTFRVAAFDGVPGDPDRPKQFAAVHLRASDGALLIGQVDYHLSDSAKIESGAWAYTVDPPPLATGLARRPNRGAYMSIEAPLPGQLIWSLWLRAGVADAQMVRSYLGAGIAGQGFLDSRPDDRIGLAVARAGIDARTRAALMLPRAETTLEASYQYRLRERFAIQPDVQYVHHPAGISQARNALVFGLRLVMTAGFPSHGSATDPTDPTVPPDGS
jgi:porin